MIRPSFTIAAVLVVLSVSVCAHRLHQDPPSEGLHPAEIDVVAPKLIGSSGSWRNTGGKKASIKIGRVTVVDFFTFG